MSLSKKIMQSSLPTCIICLIAGVVTLCWPAAIVTTLFQILGIILALIGVAFLGMALATHQFAGRLGRLVPGLVCLMFGLAMFAKPESCAKVVPVMVGFVLIYHGIRHLLFALEARKTNLDKWWLSMALAVITVVVGVIMVAYSWQAILVGLRLMGILLIFDAVCGIFINIKTKRHEKKDVIDIPYDEF